MKKSTIVFTIAMALTALMPLSFVRAQDTNVASQGLNLSVNGSALLAIKTPTIGMVLSGATEAGGAIKTEAADSTTRLRISSLVDGNVLKRKISAKLDVQPVGANLIVSVLNPTSPFASGTSVQGTLLPNVILSAATASDIITGIGTCWSGITDDSGYVIKYTYKMIDGAPVVTGTAVVVTYTLSDPA